MVVHDVNVAHSVTGKDCKGNPRPDFYGGRLRLYLSRTGYDTRVDYRLPARAPATPVLSCQSAPLHRTTSFEANLSRSLTEGQDKTLCGTGPPRQGHPLLKRNLFHQQVAVIRISESATPSADYAAHQLYSAAYQRH